MVLRRTRRKPPFQARSGLDFGLGLGVGTEVVVCHDASTAATGWRGKAPFGVPRRPGPDTQMGTRHATANLRYEKASGDQERGRWYTIGDRTSATTNVERNLRWHVA